MKNETEKLVPLFSVAEFTPFDRNSLLYLAIDLQQLFTMERIYFLSLAPSFSRAKLFILLHTPAAFLSEFKLVCSLVKTWTFKSIERIEEMKWSSSKTYFVLQD